VPKLFQQFLDLDGAPPARFLAFARRYGLLEICDHAKPGVHFDCFPLRVDVEDDLPVPAAVRAAAARLARRRPDPADDRYYDVSKGVWYWEPLVAMRAYCRLFGALVGLVNDMRAGEPTAPEDWSWISEYDRRMPQPIIGPGMEEKVIQRPPPPRPGLGTKDLLLGLLPAAPGRATYPADRERWGPEDEERFRSVSFIARRAPLGFRMFLVAHVVGHLLREVPLQPVVVGLDGIPRLETRVARGRWMYNAGPLAFIDPAEAVRPYHPYRRNNLFTVLVQRLDAVLNTPYGPLRCTHCARPFDNPGGRKPQKGRNRLCDARDCRKAASRASSRKNRLKNLEKAAAEARAAAEVGGDAGHA
jgi:hypothetical protein